MKWNDAKERKEFIKNQNKLHKEYLAAGMTEEQFKDLYEYDLGVYRNKRKEAIHTQKFDFDSAEFDDKETDNPLFQKFLEKISALPKYSDTSRFGWIEEISDERLYKTLKSLDKQDLELITRIAVDDMSQSEIGMSEHVTQQAISKKIERIKKIFKKRL
ncbi:MAG: sigma-70 family RNA polymerase sigma factor [Clostridia bacterium]|nr:sigma-70 family RNA polymerase sigma factor [Clostridia bacterium]